MIPCVVCLKEFEEAVSLISHMNAHHKRVEIVRDLVYYLVLKEKDKELANKDEKKHHHGWISKIPPLKMD